MRHASPRRVCRATSPDPFCEVTSFVKYQFRDRCCFVIVCCRGRVATGGAMLQRRVAIPVLALSLARLEVLLNLLFAFLGEALRWPRRIWVSSWGVGRQLACSLTSDQRDLRARHSD